MRDGGCPRLANAAREQGIFQSVVAESTRQIGIDGRTRFPGRGSQAGVGGQMRRCTEACDGADLDGDARPEARTDAWQATQDRRLGQGEKTLFDLLLQFVAPREDRRELGSQLNDQSGGGLSTTAADRLGPRRVMQLFGESLRSTHPLGSQCCRELVDASLLAGRTPRILLEECQHTAAVQTLAESSLERGPMRGQEGAQPIGQPIGITAQIGVVAAQQLQVRLCFAGGLQPDDTRRMHSGHIGRDERVLRIGLALASVEVAGARHRQPMQIADPDLRLPTQTQRLGSRPARLINYDGCLVGPGPVRYLLQRGLVIGHSNLVDHFARGIYRQGVCALLPMSTPMIGRERQRFGQ